MNYKYRDMHVLKAAKFVLAALKIRRRRDKNGLSLTKGAQEVFWTKRCTNRQIKKYAKKWMPNGLTQNSYDRGHQL